MNAMSEDAKAILLLCGHLGGESEFEPLGLTDYNQIVVWLKTKGLRPADLLTLDSLPDLARATALPEQRLAALLKRGVKLGFAVEKWNQSGIWVICRSDPDYPARYRSHLKEKAPPILFGTGERTLLQGGGVAIVGSRNVDAEGDAYARDVAAWCARGGLPVVSGGARGVDQVAMTSALEAGGAVVGVLADALLKRSVSREVRYALSDGRLLLISPYHPDAGFSVGNAMGRNKLIYALADYGLVVSADHKKGGTWEGAVEELKRKPGRPVFVRLGDSVPEGNRKLVDLGALAFPAFAGSQDPAAVLRESLTSRPAPEPKDETPLFTQPTRPDHAVGAVREAPPVSAQPPTQSERLAAEAKTAKVTEEQPANAPLTAPTTQPQTLPIPASVYDAVKPLIIKALDKPQTVDALAKALKVRKPQLQDWVKDLLKDGVLEEQVKRKVKKLAVRNPRDELPLT